ncbi:hypothetical protein BGZ93_004812 [Podila epicladia]|nr:hypothetical protein BGZ92_008578 [Podila epicladia]KAG0096252.1 hypothetical protein BGZ93_004812 [Podila epicladia]
MLSRVLLIVCAILVVINAQGPDGHRNVDSLPACYNVCLHQDGWCDENGAQLKMNCEVIHEKCVALCVQQFPNQKADFPGNKAPVHLDHLQIRNPDAEDQNEDQVKEDL